MRGGDGTKGFILRGDKLLKCQFDQIIKFGAVRVCQSGLNLTCENLPIVYSSSRDFAFIVSTVSPARRKPPQ